MPNNAMWPFNFRPKTQYGESVDSDYVALGTGGFTLVASSTVSAYIPIPRGRTVLIKRLSIQGNTAAAGGGAITAQVVKRSGGNDTNVTGTYDLTTAAAEGTNVDFPITATLQQCVLNQPGTLNDTLRVKLVCASTITTQPTLNVQVEYVTVI